VRERIEYRFRVPTAAVFTLYSYSKALEYRFRVPTAASLSRVVPLPTYVNSSGLRQNFLIIFILFLFFPFFIEETTSNQAGLQDSMKKQIACCENSSNY
jgi:hypothetical protein